MGMIVEFIDDVISDIDNEALISSIGDKVVNIMKDYPLFNM